MRRSQLAAMGVSAIAIALIAWSFLESMNRFGAQALRRAAYRDELPQSRPMESEPDYHAPSQESTTAASIANSASVGPARDDAIVPRVRLRFPNGLIVQTDIEATGSTASDNILDFRETPPIPYGDPTLDGRLTSEPVDASWARNLESTLWNIASAVGQIREVDCRTTFCIVTMLRTDKIYPTNANARAIAVHGEFDYLRESIRAVIDSSAGRLEHYTFNSVDTTQEQFELRLVVYGPPEVEARSGTGD